MIYKVHYSIGGESEGYKYFGSKKKALADIKDWTREQEEMDKKYAKDMAMFNNSSESKAKISDVYYTPTSKKEIINLLNLIGSHADNG
jgi:hypothetical protein